MNVEEAETLRVVPLNSPNYLKPTEAKNIHRTVFSWNGITFEMISDDLYGLVNVVAIFVNDALIKINEFRMNSLPELIKNSSHEQIF